MNHSGDFDFHIRNNIKWLRERCGIVGRVACVILLRLFPCVFGLKAHFEGGNGEGRDPSPLTYRLTLCFVES